MRSRALTIAVGAVILIVLLLYLFSFQVRETETAVLLTFGKPTASIDSSESANPAGLHFMWPWPIQSVRKFDRRLNLFDTTLEEALTSDRQNVVVGLAVGWRIEDPLKFLTASAGSEAQAQSLVKRLVDHQTSVIGQYRLENFVSTDPNLIKFPEIEEALAKPVSDEAFKEYGVRVPLLRIRRLELPEGPTAAVYNRMRTERQKDATRFRMEGQGQANVIVARAQSERTAILAKANADADRIRAEGDAEAAKYYTTFAQNPELAIFLRQIKSLPRILGERSTIVLDVRTMPFNLLAGNGVKIPVATSAENAVKIPDAPVQSKDQTQTPTTAKAGG